MIEKIKTFFDNKTNIIIALAILSTIVLPVTYSRYIERETGNVSSTIAKWEITYLEDNEDLELISKNVSSASYLFSITSTSEVACDYSLTIHNVPESLSLTIDDNPTIYEPNDDEIIYVENMGMFEINDINNTHDHILNFTTDGNLDSGTFKINIDVKTAQRIGSEQ